MKNSLKVFFMVLGVAAMMLVAFDPARPMAASAATPPNPFWKGKIITILVGTTPPGGLDTTARLFARHLSKYLPQHPVVIVRNMPEGKGMGMVNHLYRSKPDGLSIGIIPRDLPVRQLTNFPGVQFDLSKIGWIGNANKIESIFFVRADKGWNSIAEIKKTNLTVNAAAAGKGSLPHQLLRALELAFGLKFNYVHYVGPGDRVLAIERGEVDAGTYDVDAFMATSRHLLDRGVVKILAQSGPKRNPLFPNAPTIPELLQQLPTNPTGAALMRALLDTIEVGRPFGGPPGLPKDRLDDLRKGFAKTLKDADFLAEAKKLEMDIQPASGEEIGRLVNRIVGQSPEVVNLFQEMFK